MQQITIQAVNKGSLIIILSVVYGENWIAQREILWDDLRIIHQYYGHKPWSILGEFNTARSINEKLGGNQLSFEKFEPSINLLMIVIYQTLGALVTIGLGIITNWLKEGF